MQTRNAKRLAVLKLLGGNNAENDVKILVSTLPVLVADVFLMLSKYHQDLSNLKSLLEMGLTEHHRFVFTSLSKNERNMRHIEEIALREYSTNLENFLSHGPRNMERLRIAWASSEVVYKHEQSIRMAAQSQQQAMMVNFRPESGGPAYRGIVEDLSLFYQANKEIIQVGKDIIVSVGGVAQEAMLTSVIRRDILSCNVTNATLCQYTPILSKIVTMALPSKFVLPEIIHVAHFGLPKGFFESLRLISKVSLAYTLDSVAFDYQISHVVMGTFSCLYAFVWESDDNQGREMSEILDNIFTDNSDIVALASLSQTTSYLVVSSVGYSFVQALLISGAALLMTDYVLTACQKGTLAALPSFIEDVYDLLPEQSVFTLDAIDVLPCP